MYARLNGILTPLAQQHNFKLLQNAPTDKSRICYLAKNLANYGVLMIMADIPANNYNFLTKAWMDNYYYLYAVFAKNLFPSSGDGIKFVLIDQLRPPVALMQAKSTAIVQILAGYIVPYIAMCQETGNISSPEIRGLIAYILEDLESTHIERAKYDRITNNSEELIKRLIALPFRQHTLTTMEKQLFQKSADPQAALELIPVSPPPEIMPETGPLNPNTLTRVMAERESEFERPKVMPETGPLNPNTPELEPKPLADTQSLPRLNFGNREGTERSLPVRPLPKDDD